MKRFVLFLLHLIIYTNFYNITYGAGFVSNTLVQIINQKIPIAHLKVNDYVVSHRKKNCCTVSLPYQITKRYCFIANSYIKIRVQDTDICTAIDQQFYSITKKDWIAASDLVQNDLLLCLNDSSVCIQAVGQIDQPILLYSVSVNESHTFCISQHAIVVHNGEPITMATGWAALLVSSFTFPIAAPLIVFIG
jgi:hypothetical protein